MDNGKKLKIIFINKSFQLGGTETLILRMALWCAQKDISVSIFCENMTVEIRNSLVNDNINIVYLKKLDDKEIKTKLEEYDDSYKLNIYSFDFNAFMQIENARKKINSSLNIDTYLYVVHPNCLIKTGRLKIPFIKEIYVSFYKSIIIKLLKNNNVLFMDEQTIEATQNYYNIIINEDAKKIIRLPMFIQKVSPNIFKEKYKKDTFNILTIARAEFPFKGYLIGLIDDYEKLKKTYEYLCLSIISYGEGEEIIRDKIARMPIDIQKDIKLIGKIPYEMLNNYFDEANLYIGMGTTVLDAANNGVPSIVTAFNTHECITTGYFWQNVDNLGYCEEKMLPCKELIKEVVSMSLEEYIEMCRNNYKYFEEMYNIDYIMGKIINSRNLKKQVAISKRDLKIVKMFSRH